VFRTRTIPAFAAAAIVAASIVTRTAVAGPSHAASGLEAARTIEFSGRNWLVRSNPTIARGPGPNYFSNSPRNVWVDGRGRLHLKITHVNGRWYCAAVISNQTFGYGRYTFTVGSYLHRLGPHIVLGMFTWDVNPAFHDREIDIEFGRFGIPGPTDGDFTVQPYNRNGHSRRFIQAAFAPSTHWFDWQHGAVRFGSTSATPSHWMYVGRDVAPPGAAHVRINLWLFRGAPPISGKPLEIIINSFTFRPR
jgi:hypothetical protein